LNRFFVPLGAFALLVIVLAVGVDRAPEKDVIASPLIGKPAPVFVLPDLLKPDTPFDSRSLAGRWYALNIWGTWCPECRHEHDALLGAKSQDRIALIGLNWKDEDSLAQAWLAQLGNPYEAVPVDREGRIAIDWGAYGAPETFLVNPEGIVVYKHVGALTPEIWREQFLARVARAGQGGER
jgi:cytochrome c biogenesis protein CcmG/thiol:disulfide interchange protein DsbE